MNHSELRTVDPSRHYRLLRRQERVEDTLALKLTRVTPPQCDDNCSWHLESHLGEDVLQMLFGHLECDERILMLMRTGNHRARTRGDKSETINDSVSTSHPIIHHDERSVNGKSTNSEVI